MKDMSLDYGHIRSSEVNNTSRVDFYKDGETYYAFDRSAWFVSSWLSPGQSPVQRYVNSIPMVYIAFTAEELEALLKPFKFVTRTAEKTMIPAQIPFNINAYYNWRNQNGDRSAARRAEDKREDRRLRDRLWDCVRAFDIQHASPDECRALVVRLKRIVEAE